MNFDISPGPAGRRAHSGVLDFPLPAYLLPSDVHLEPAPQMASLKPTRLKVVMAYEDAEAGERARQKLDEWLADAWPDVEMELIQWPFDFLSDPESLDMATSDAAAAGLLIFASSTSDLGASAGDAWLASSLAARPGPTTTLLAFFGAGEPCTISIEHDRHTVVMSPGDSARATFTTVMIESSCAA
jgi:hypothetical protein